MTYAEMHARVQAGRDRTKAFYDLWERLLRLAEAAGLPPPPTTRIDLVQQWWINDPRKGYASKAEVRPDGLSTAFDVIVGDYGRRTSLTPEEVVAVLQEGIPADDAPLAVRALWGVGDPEPEVER